MTGVAVAAGGTTTALVSGKDIQIIACTRDPSVAPFGISPRASGPGRCVGVRWASQAGFGFPPSGYHVQRRLPNLPPIARGGTQDLGIFFLPATDDWVAFERDAGARRPACGPYFDVLRESDLGFLLPLVRLADPRTPAAELAGLVTNAADFFGNIHKDDAELAWKIWRLAPPPPLADLLADPVNAPLVIAFYRARAVDFLLVLAQRFEYAALFGLALDDRAPAGDLQYEVQATWGRAASGTASSDILQDGTYCAPAAPEWVKITRTPGSVPYGAFALWPAWTPPAELAPEDPSGRPMPATATVPRVPATWSALAWAPPPARTTLIDYGPVLYTVSRYDHGAASAAVAQPPPVPPGAVFARVGDGEPLIRPGSEPHLVDFPGMPWPPLEGHYSYDVRGIDLLGTVSRAAARSSVRHFDDIAPPSPRARSDAGPVYTLAANATTLDVPLVIAWDSAEDFIGPDTVEFRVAGQWTPLESTSVHIEDVDDSSILHADVTVTTLAGTANRFAGAYLSTPGVDYPIVSHTVGSPATIVVRKARGKTPAPDTDALISGAGTTSPLTRVSRLARRQAVPATVSAVTLGPPVEIELTAAGPAALPADATARIYLHLLRETVDAVRVGSSRWRLTTPVASSPESDSWTRWLALGDPTTAMESSPVILFPPHALTATIAAPTGFSAGLLTLAVTAADGTTYVDSPTLPVADASLAGAKGNESTRTEVIVSVRSLTPPAAPTVPPWDPNLVLWATSAANYAESARYTVQWTAGPGAARFEVWRALEGALSGVTGTTTDGALRTLAAAQAGAFELRSDQVFGAKFTDALPGRAPTRALYRIRAISSGGVAGALSDVIGPVHVPDVRQPPAPNLLRATAAPPAEADRTIALEWTQSGPTEDVRWDVFYRQASALASTPFATAGTVPVGAVPGPVGRYRFLHPARAPGRLYLYRVQAVRVARDPIDPTGAATRDIASALSEEHTGFAVSATPLAPPTSLSAQLAPGTSDVVLTWLNRDDYESIEVRRKPVDRYAYMAVGAVAGDATAFTDAAVPSGKWSYQLRALGVSREARSPTDVQVVIP